MTDIESAKAAITEYLELVDDIRVLRFILELLRTW